MNPDQKFTEGTTRLPVETKERWRELCERVLGEQDPDRFMAIIQELLEVLEDHDNRRRGATV